MRWIPILLGSISLLAHADADSGGGSKLKSGTFVDTFLTAAVDAIAGPPDETSLQELRSFKHAGIAFQYPAALHVTLEQGDEGSARWKFGRGDFELELDASLGVSHARDYLRAFAGLLADEKANSEWIDDPAVTWCGHEILPSHLRVTLFGDRHDMRAFDLPAPEGETRFVIFEDVLADGRLSKLATAAYATFTKSLQCETKPDAERASQP
jgi:hypothetical protein